MSESKKENSELLNENSRESADTDTGTGQFILDQRKLGGRRQLQIDFKGSDKRQAPDRRD